MGAARRRGGGAGRWRNPALRRGARQRAPLRPQALAGRAEALGSSSRTRPAVPSGPRTWASSAYSLQPRGEPWPPPVDHSCSQVSRSGRLRGHRRRTRALEGFLDMEYQCCCHIRASTGCFENLYYNGVDIIDLSKKHKPEITLH
ncbi:Hypothetical predicted protein, partial [Marmota monax]